MDCDSQVAELLPWYLNGSLDQAERERVEEHLKVCPHCREKLAQMVWFYEGLRKYGKVLLSGHIDAEKLVSYVHTPDELTESDRTIIRTHLKRCPECREELRILKSSAKELGILHLTESVSKGQGSLLAGLVESMGVFVERVSWLIRRPVFAYLLVLLLAYPAYLGLLKKRPGSVRQVVLTSNEVVLTEQIRGTAQETPQVHITSPGILRVRILYPIDTTFSLGYGATISDGRGNTIWQSEDWRQFDVANGQLFWVFELNTLSLPSGPIEVGIRKYRRDRSSTYPTAVYRFHLTD